MNFRTILIGGLGNQMFQYAFAKTLSLDYNTDLYVKSSSIIYRPYLLNIFGIEDNEGININWNKKIEELEVYKKGFENNYKNLEDNNYDIHGYWQNENYFLKYEEQIRKDFHIDPIISDDNSVTIQVRRGDYVNNPRFEYCTIEWYEKAINYYGIKNLNIISDDPYWCNWAFSKYKPNIIVGNEEEHLRYMIGSKNLIISNSTFAWWGAWLSKSKNVIYPDVWLPCIPEQDTGSNKWIRLKK